MISSIGDENVAGASTHSTALDRQGRLALMSGNAMRYKGTQHQECHADAPPARASNFRRNFDSSPGKINRIPVLRQSGIVLGVN